jgi:hypothetical protein
MKNKRTDGAGPLNPQKEPGGKGFGRSNCKGSSGPEGFHGDGELSRRAIKSVMPFGLASFERTRGRYTKFRWDQFKSFMISYALLTNKPI